MPQHGKGCAAPKPGQHPWADPCMKAIPWEPNVVWFAPVQEVEWCPSIHIQNSAGVSQTLISHTVSHCKASSIVHVFNVQSTARLPAVPRTPLYRNSFLLHFSENWLNSELSPALAQRLESYLSFHNPAASVPPGAWWELLTPQSWSVVFCFMQCSSSYLLLT